MIICHCKALSDREIKTAARECPAASLGDIERRCAAGTVCGGCRPAIARILAEAAPRAQGEARSAAPALAR